ncbi:MAG: MFS transporter [Chloroflexota bacterium]|nr:MFS transporter [Chloroflexota bacterium]
MLIATPLLVLALTGSATQAGLTAAFGGIPSLLLGLPAGALIDRWNRKAIMMVADTVRFLAVGSVPLTYALGHLSMPQLYLVAMVSSAAAVFFDNAEVSSLPRVVPHDQLARASAFNETGGWLAATLGPGLGGFIISLARTTLAGAVLANLVNSLSLVISVLSLAVIGIPFQEERTVAPWSALRSEMVEGLRFLWQHRQLRDLTLFAAVQMVLGGPATLAVIVLARNDLHSDARTIGLIFSALSLGGLLGSILAPWLIARCKAGHIIVGAVAVQALAVPLLAAAVAPWMVIAGWTILVLVGPAYEATQQAYRLTVTPDGLRGRVNSVYGLLVSGTEPLTLALTGLLLAALGPRALLWLLAAVVMGAVIAAVLTGMLKTRIADATIGSPVIG